MDASRRFCRRNRSLAGLKEAVGRIEDAAVAQEKFVLRTRIFGYDRKRLQALKTLDYKLGASIPDQFLSTESDSTCTIFTKS